MLMKEDFELVRTIFKVPTRISLMNEVCDRVVHSVARQRSASSVMLFAQGQPLQVPFLSEAHRKAFTDPAYLAELQSMSDTQTALVMDLAKRAPFEFHNALDMISADRHREVEYISERLEAWFGCYHQLGTTISRQEKYTGMFTICLPREFDPVAFAIDDKPVQISKLIADSLDLVSLFQSLEARYARVLGVLDRLLLGVVITDQNFNVLVSNKLGDQMMEEVPGFASAHGKLLLGQPARRAAESALQHMQKPDQTMHGHTFALGLGDRDNRFAGMVRPLCMTKDEFDSEVDTLVFILLDQQKSHITDLELTTTTLGLTAAERETLTYLMQGDTYKAIAEKRNVSPETTKTQVSSILAKGQCDGVHQLLLKVARLDTPFDFS